MIYKIDDANDSRLDELMRLSETELLRMYEPKPGLFAAESPNVILRAMDAGYEPISILLCEDDLQPLPDEIDEALGKSKDEYLLKRVDAHKNTIKAAFDAVDQYSQDATVYLVTRDISKQIQGFEMTRGAVCLMRRRKLPTVEDLLVTAKKVAILEEVTNPTNLGAIFRCAAALGIDTLILSKGCANPLYKRSMRVGMGTMFQVAWTYTDNVADTMNLLKSRGFVTLAMALDDRAISIENVGKTGEKVAILLGNEGYGLRDETVEASDMTVMIPMTAGVDSLNVASASAIAFWELGRAK